jgi:hypothetical protein
MTKLPGIFGKYFKREGVVYAVNKLVAIDSSNVPDPIGLVARGKPVNETVMRAWLQEQARLFKEKYFDQPTDAMRTSCSDADRIDEFATDELKELFRLSSVLNRIGSCSTSTAAESESKEIETLDRIRSILCTGDGVSTFEFWRSGCIKGLLGYLIPMADESMAVVVLCTCVIFISSTCVSLSLSLSVCVCVCEW